MVSIVEDSIKVSGFKPLYQFFVKAKSLKQIFFLTFADSQSQEVMEYRLERVDYKPSKMKKPGLDDVSLTFIPAKKVNFDAVLEVGNQLRLEFFFEGFVNYFVVEVSFVASGEDGLSFSVKMPEQVLAKQRRRAARIDVVEESGIDMYINDKLVDLLNVSAGGAAALIPLANKEDLEIGKAIKNLRLNIDDFIAPLSAEVCHVRPHRDGDYLIVGLRFIFYGYTHEEQLMEMIRKRTDAVA